MSFSYRTQTLGISEEFGDMVLEHTWKLFSHLSLSRP
jgi:hypothetical protein